MKSDSSAKNDAALQEAAAKILLDDPDMGSVSITSPAQELR
jgi:hypothetical protein